MIFCLSSYFSNKTKGTYFPTHMNTILKKFDEKNIEIIQLFLSSMSFVMFFLALFSSFKYEQSGDMRFSRFVFWGIGLVFFFGAYVIHSEEVKDQLRIILGVVSIIELLLIPSFGILIKESAVFALFSYAGTFFLSIILFYIDRSFWKTVLIRKKTLCIIAAAILISLASIRCISHNTVYFLWDSHDMFELVSANDIYSLWDFSRLALSDHVSYSYAAMCTVFKLLICDTMVGQALFGVILYAIGVYGFYKCVVLFCSSASKNDIAVQVVLTALFACSPYMLGMITYSYPDYAMWCVMPILVYVLYTKKYLLAVFIGYFFIFCKETALISYVLFIFGFYIVDLIKSKKLFYEFHKYIIMSIPCFMWLIAYYLVGHWEGNGAFEIDPNYIKAKLLSLLAINFNWLLIALALIVFIIGVLKKTQINKSISLIPMLFSMIAFLIFSVLFKTINHPRYIDALAAQIYLVMAYILINYIDKKAIKIFISSALILLLFIQSFATIDPLMLKLFPNINIGNKTLITTSEILSDGMAYNRQYQGWGKVVDMALEDVMNDDSAKLYLPAVANATWHFDAMGWYENLNNRTEIKYTDYWNSKRKTRMADCDNGQEYSVHVISEDHIFDLGPDRTGYYLYSPLYGNEIAESIKNNYTFEETTFNYKGWLVYRIKFGNL